AQRRERVVGQRAVVPARHTVGRGNLGIAIEIRAEERVGERLHAGVGWLRFRDGRRCAGAAAGGRTRAQTGADEASHHGRDYSALVQARHLTAAAGTVSWHCGHTFVAVGGGRNRRTIMKTTNATITKSTTVPRNAP